MSHQDYYLVKIMNISLSNYGFVIFLKEEEETKALPICIGAAEVNSISIALSGQRFPRPLSHTLFKNILEDLGCKITKIAVTDLKDGTFYARIFIDYKGVPMDFDSRPSDAIALALRFKAPIYVNPQVYKEAAVEYEDKESEAENKSEKLEDLKKTLEDAIKEERYEDAAKIRDKIQQLQLDDLTNN